MNYADLAQAYVADLYPLIVYGKPKLADLPPGAVLGNWQYSVRNQVRFIFDREAEIVPGVLPGDLARTWIRDVYNLPIKRRKVQIEEQCYQAPLHAVIGRHGDCAYVDIHKAYCQILALGYDLEYRRGLYIGANPVPVPDEIQAVKFAYALAVTMSKNAIGNIEVMGKHGVVTTHPFNAFSNPCLYNLAQDTLAAIGAEMLAVLGEHCVYMNTDGYIVHSDCIPFALDIVRSWGFSADIKVKHGETLQGDTEVYGVSSYRCGNYKTKRRDPQPENYTSVMPDRDERRWLKTRWVKWSTRL